MEYKNLGRAGLKVSSLCLGTVNFGWMSDEAESFAIMDRALEAGINIFDTADSYNYKCGDNSSESIIGRWLAQGKGRREKIVLATKVYATLGPGPNDSKLSARHIKQACEASLRRLQTDYLDLYQMHHIDRSTPWEEIWQAMEQLTREGKIIYVGSCNFAGWHIATANSIARERHFMGLVSEQSIYNLSKREIELEVIPACQAYGLGLFPYSPLAGGLLCGGVKEAREGRRSQPEIQRRLEEVNDRLAQYLALCRELEEEPTSIALAWVLRQPGVTSPIIGPRTVAQLDGCLRALDMTLSDETLVKLDEIWPGPGGPAPEAYAW